jgi:hypothetical protein
MFSHEVYMFPGHPIICICPPCLTSWFALLVLYPHRQYSLPSLIFLKGSVFRKIRPLNFCIRRSHLGPVSYTKAILNFNFRFAKTFQFESHYMQSPTVKNHFFLSLQGSCRGFKHRWHGQVCLIQLCGK